MSLYAGYFVMRLTDPHGLLVLGGGDGKGPQEWAYGVYLGFRYGLFSTTGFLGHIQRLFPKNGFFASKVIFENRKMRKALNIEIPQIYRRICKKGRKAENFYFPGKTGKVLWDSPKADNLFEWLMGTTSSVKYRADAWLKNDSDCKSCSFKVKIARKFKDYIDANDLQSRWDIFWDPHAEWFLKTYYGVEASFDVLEKMTGSWFPVRANRTEWYLLCCDDPSKIVRK